MSGRGNGKKRRMSGRSVQREKYRRLRESGDPKKAFSRIKKGTDSKGGDHVKRG